MKRKRLLFFLLLIPFLLAGNVQARIVSVCTDTGLSGAAQQENLLYCSTNLITGVTTNAAGSTYQASITLAATKHLIVGTPISVIEAVDWSGTPITYVEFSSGFHAEHYNPSNGHVRIYDSYDHLVLST